jgi:LPXTG-site transpeptidase (sortase) family protein
MYVIVTHRRFNDALTVVIVLFALYIIGAPYYREIAWVVDSGSEAPYIGRLSGVDTATGTVSGPPVENRIVIPSAKVNLSIKEGTDLSVVDNGGSWRKPINTSSPKDTGNTVIVAHRFFYRMPDSGFYHLDKVKVGDMLAVYWEGEELLYTVIEQKVVEATAIEVESNTSERLLTLYTCTPVMTAENRLVLTAKPVEASARSKSFLAGRMERAVW